MQNPHNEFAKAQLKINAHHLEMIKTLSERVLKLETGYEVKKSEKFSKDSDSGSAPDRNKCMCRSCQAIAFRERGEL